MPRCFYCFKFYQKPFDFLFCSKKCYKANQRINKPLRRWLKKHPELKK